MSDTFDRLKFNLPSPSDDKWMKKIDEIALLFKMSREEILGKDRTRPRPQIRQVIMYLRHMNDKMTLDEAASIFSSTSRDGKVRRLTHCDTLHAKKNISAMQYDPYLRGVYDSITNLIPFEGNTISSSLGAGKLNVGQSIVVKYTDADHRRVLLNKMVKSMRYYSLSRGDVFEVTERECSFEIKRIS